MSRIPNPFSGYGSPVDPDKFQGREDLIYFIKERLESDSPMSIVGERRTGKTSTLRYIMSHEAAEAFGLNSGRFVFIYIDLLRLNNPTARDFWAYLLREVERSAASHPWQKVASQLVEDIQGGKVDNQNLDYLVEDFFDRVKRYEQRIVFLLDEFDQVARSENLGVDFFSNLRSLTLSRITLVIASRSPLDEICRSDVRVSSFFNVVAVRSLMGFSTVEFEEWLENRLLGTGIVFSREDRDFIVELSGRHPFFSDLIAQRVFNARRQKNVMDKEDYRLIAEESAVETRKFFEDYWEYSMPAEQVVLTLLSLPDGKRQKLKRKDFSGEKLVFPRLVSRALVQRDEDSYFLFSAQFAEFVSDQVRAHASEQTFEKFLEDYIARRPEVMFAKGLEKFKQFFLHIEPRIWSLLIEFLNEYHQQPEALMQNILRQMSRS